MAEFSDIQTREIGLQKALTARQLGMIALGGAIGTGPVSFTHLRAHETVLDLVCRLLLEKKKKTRTLYPYAQRFERMTCRGR